MSLEDILCKKNIKLKTVKYSFDYHSATGNYTHPLTNRVKSLESSPLGLPWRKV